MGGVLHPVVTLTLTPEQASRVAAALHFAARDLYRNCGREQAGNYLETYEVVVEQCRRQGVPA